MAKGLSATQRTLKALRQMGRRCDIVERFNPYVGQHGIRQDLFNIIDLIALDPERGIVGVQCTTGNCYSDHWKKLTVDHAQESYDWVECGGILELWAWRKIKVKRGGKAMIWKPRIVEITIGELI